MPLLYLGYCERRYFRAVHIFALFAFIKCPRNIYIVKITFIMLHRGNSIKNPKINPCEIANFRKCAKFDTCENIYVHSIHMDLLLVIALYICLITPNSTSCVDFSGRKPNCQSLSMLFSRKYDNICLCTIL